MLFAKHSQCFGYKSLQIAGVEFEESTEGKMATAAKTEHHQIDGHTGANCILHCLMLINEVPAPELGDDDILKWGGVFFFGKKKRAARTPNPGER